LALQRTGLQKPDVLLPLPQHGERVRLVVRGDDALDEPLRLRVREEGGGVGIDGPVEREDAAEGRLRVAVPGEGEGVGEAARDRSPARVVVLDDHRRRPGELADEVEGRVEVEDVVVTEFLAVQLLRGCDAGVVGRAVGVERGLLVRVLAVAEFLVGDEQQRQHRGVEKVHLAGWAAGQEVVGDGMVVGGDPRERAAGQFPPALPTELPAVLGEFPQDGGVRDRIDHHRHRVEVLGRGPHHARAADVDVLDHLRLGHARLRHRLLERVEVAHDQVDLRQVVLEERRHVLRLVAAGQEAGVDRRVERLDAAVEDLGEAGQFADVLDRQPGIGQQLLRAAGGDQLHAVLPGEFGGERDQPGLVGHAQQGAADGAEHGGFLRRKSLFYDARPI
jgi:hypothetical protein